MSNRDDLSNKETMIENQVNKALNDSIENLSTDTRRQLNQIRIEASQSKPHFQPLSKTALAFSIVLALTLTWQFWPAQSPIQNTEMPLEPFAEVLQEDLDMLEDLEFVYWMAEENEHAIL